MQQLRATIQSAGLPQESLEGANASIDGALALGASGEHIEQLAKTFYRDGFLKKITESDANERVMAVLSDVPFIEYVKALNVLVGGVSVTSETSGVDIFAIARSLEQSVVAENFDMDVLSGLRQSINGATMTRTTA